MCTPDSPRNSLCEDCMDTYRHGRNLGGSLHDLTLTFEDVDEHIDDGDEEWLFAAASFCPESSKDFPSTNFCPACLAGVVARDLAAMREEEMNGSMEA